MSVLCLPPFFQFLLVGRFCISKNSRSCVIRVTRVIDLDLQYTACGIATPLYGMLYGYWNASKLAHVPAYDRLSGVATPAAASSSRDHTRKG